jgi:hypothetical protein
MMLVNNAKAPNTTVHKAHELTNDSHCTVNAGLEEECEVVTLVYGIQYIGK